MAATSTTNYCIPLAQLAVRVRSHQTLSLTVIRVTRVTFIHVCAHRTYAHWETDALAQWLKLAA